MNFLFKNSVFVFLLFLVSCKHKSDDIQPESEKGCKVETVVKYIDGELRSREVNEYDENFNLLRTSYSNADGSATSEYNYKYSYNTYGQLAEKLLIGKSIVLSKTIYEYHSNGVVKLEATVFNDLKTITEIEYDVNSNEIRNYQKNISNTENEVLTTYYKKNKILNQKTTVIVNGVLNNTDITSNKYNRNDSIFRTDRTHSYLGGSSVYSNVYEYDDFGKLINDEEYASTILTAKTHYTYNDNGDILKSTRTSPINSLKIETSYEYDEKWLLLHKLILEQYDGHNSWIEEDYQYFSNGNLKQKISYFPFDDLNRDNKRIRDSFILDDQGNPTSGKIYDIDGMVIFETNSTYICRM